MAQSGVTVYDILLSCPNDIVELKTVIQECIEIFNNSLGKVKSSRLELKHWSNSSFSQYGERAQDVLSHQFIDDCDLCVALFGSRFGSPTGEYDSGTEEEIDNMISQGKQVFLYFFEKPVAPNEIDIEQLRRVKEYKNKYSGLYATVKSEEELRIKFLIDIMLYYIKKISIKSSEEALLNLRQSTENLYNILNKRDPIFQLAEFFANSAESIQIAILRNLFNICSDVNLIDYNEALENACMFLKNISRSTLSNSVKEYYDKALKDINYALQQDYEDLWQDSGSTID